MVGATPINKSIFVPMPSPQTGEEHLTEYVLFADKLAVKMLGPEFIKFSIPPVISYQL
jgi:hypothetical protein